jgi:hypothetical protein
LGLIAIVFDVFSVVLVDSVRVLQPPVDASSRDGLI